MKYFFKYHFPSKHYALIVAENNKDYFYLSLMHTSKVRSRQNIRLHDNPNSLHAEPAFLNKEIRKNPIKNFAKRTAKHLYLSTRDELMVTEFLKTKNKSFVSIVNMEPERER